MFPVLAGCILLIFLPSRITLNQEQSEIFSLSNLLLFISKREQSKITIFIQWYLNAPATGIWISAISPQPVFSPLTGPGLSLDVISWVPLCCKPNVLN
jgi:hypothetical protein